MSLESWSEPFLLFALDRNKLETRLSGSRDNLRPSSICIQLSCQVTGFHPCPSPLTPFPPPPTDTPFFHPNLNHYSQSLFYFISPKSCLLFQKRMVSFPHPTLPLPAPISWLRGKTNPGNRNLINPLVGTLTDLLRVFKSSPLSDHFQCLLFQSVGLLLFVSIEFKFTFQ